MLDAIRILLFVSGIVNVLLSSVLFTRGGRPFLLAVRQLNGGV